jgi:hypothetical protein
MAWQIAIGVIVIIVLILIAVLAADSDWLNVLDVLDCCSFFTILVAASLVTIGGLVLWHSLLLAEVAGESIMTVILIGWCLALRKQFLAKRKS